MKAATVSSTAHDILDARILRAALEHNAFNRLAAAKELGIHKTTLFRRMKKLGICWHGECSLAIEMRASRTA